MINLLNYLSISFCLIGVYSKNLNNKFQIPLFLILFISLYIIGYDSYTLLFAIIIICLYERVLCRKRNFFTVMYYSVNAVVIILYFIALSSTFLLVILNLEYTDVTYCYFMLALMPLGAVLYCFFSKSKDISNINTEILVSRIGLHIICIIVYIFVIPFINQSITSKYFHSFINILFILISVGIYVFNRKIIKLTAENEAIKDMTSTYDAMKDMYIEILKINHLLNDLISKGEVSENILNSLLSDMESKVIPISFIKDTEKIKFNAIKDLLCFFYIRSMASNIIMNLYVQEEITKLKIAESDLIKILLSYLGNAFTAAKKSENKILNVYFSQDFNVVSITIENSMTGTCFNRMVKGTGTEICEEIIRKYSNIENSTSVKLNMFTQELVINYK